MKTKFQGKVCFITGATGIAAATAEAASEQGAEVFVASRTQEHGESLLKKIRSTGGVCEFYQADLTLADSCAAAVETCLKRFGRIDALFNVAGISGRSLGDGPVHVCSAEGWDRTLDTNLRSIFLMCRGVIKRMLEQPVQANGFRGVI